MDALDAIHTRRSIRTFTDKEVSLNLVEQLLSAGMTAPSAGNQQPWQFIVIKNRTLLNKIPEFHEYAQMCKQANLAILVCADLSNIKHEGMWEQDCSAATQNILLAAHALGLGAVWCGVYLRDPKMTGFRKLLNIPDKIIPFSLIPLGYTNQKSGKVGRYKKERVHTDMW
ncbi:MAG: nitroreductase family protein [Candidatus Woesearchaeota archaeon]